MNLIHEQVKHCQFGIGSITKQEEKIITVKFSDEYGIKRFTCPLAFDGFLILCNANLQDKIQDEVHLIIEQIEQTEAEQKHMEEEYRKRIKEERKKNLESKKVALKAPAPAKSSTKKASSKSKKQALSL